MGSAGVIKSETGEATEARAKPLNQEEDEGANSSVMKVDDVKDKEDGANKEDQGSASEQAASEDNTLTIIELEGMTFEERFAAYRKVYSEEGVGLVLDSSTLHVTRDDEFLREEITRAEECKKKWPEIIAKISTNDEVLVDRIARTIVELISQSVPLLTEVHLKNNVTGEDAAEIDAAEEAIAEDIALKVMDRLKPFYAQSVLGIDEEEYMLYADYRRRHQPRELQ